MSPAGTVHRFVFDLRSGKPCTERWQRQHGGDPWIGMFFALGDQQDVAPERPDIIIGTETDWHRMAIQAARRRHREGHHGTRQQRVRLFHLCATAREDDDR